VTFGAGQAAVVIDASVAIPVIQDDPAWVARMATWLDRGDLLLAPPIFRHEVANALLRGSRRSVDDALVRIPRLQALGLEIADRGWAGIERSIELAQRHGLTVYDASYLDLAIDVDAELATLDRQLAAAAAAEGVPLVAGGS
jgi:predicted nucleic acid-binding protein